MSICDGSRSGRQLSWPPFYTANERPDMNRAPAVLRFAAILALIQGIAHGALHVRYVPKHGPLEEALVASMKTESFVFAGFSRTYWGFYFGYGLMVVVTCLVQAAVLWFLARLARSRPREVTPLIGMYGVAYALHAVLAWHYFFAKPVVFDILITAALGIAAYFSWFDKSGDARARD